VYSQKRHEILAMMVYDILTHSITLHNLDKKPIHGTIITNFITVVFNEAPHGYPKATVRSHTPVHTVQLPWRGVAVNLLLLVL